MEEFMKKSKLSRIAALLAAGALLLGGVFMSCSSDDDNGSGGSTPAPETIPVTSVSIDRPDKTTISVGETLTLAATVLPEDATDNAVTWKSDTESVATVDAGVVKGVSAGEAKITATAGGVESEAVTVTVVDGTESGAVGSLEGTIY